MGRIRLLRLQLARSGLWPRMAAGLSLAFLLLLAAFGLLGERALDRSNARILGERLIAARMAAGQFDVLLEGHLTALSLLQRNAALDQSAADLSIVSHALAEALRQMDERWAGLVLWDESGNMIHVQPSNLMSLTRDLAQLSATNDISSAPPTYEAIRDPRDGRPLVAVTVSPTETDSRLGVLTVLIRMDHATFTDALSQAATVSNSGHAALVDNQGRTLISTDQAPFLSLGKHPTLYRLAISDGRAIASVAPVESNHAGTVAGQGHAMAVAPLSHVAWAVAMGEESSETFAALGRLRRDLGMLALITLGGVLTVSLIGARGLVRPVRQLTASAQLIAAGDLHVPLQVAEGGEIGEMAVALERMRQQLSANIAELADLNDNLEARVAERTLALEQQQALTQKLLRQVLNAQEEERARLSYELHDGIGQLLTAIQISLDIVGRTLPARQKAAHEQLGRARMLTEQALSDLRLVISALRPGVLDRLGLAPALGWLADHLLRPLGMDVTITVTRREGRLPGEIETILFRIAQEALNNVVRHSEASKVEVTLNRHEGFASLAIRDNGRGFDPSALEDTSETGRGLGLAGMAERAQLVQGRFRIESAPGKGVLVLAEIPLPYDNIGRQAQSDGGPADG